jgi:hypothetical protein
MVLAASAVAFLVGCILAWLPEGLPGPRMMGSARAKRAMAGRLRITVPAPSRVTSVSSSMRRKGGELLQRDIEEAGFRAGIGDALAPVAGVRLRRPPDEREQVTARRPRPAR